MPLLEVNSTQSSQQIIAQFNPHLQPKIIVDEKLYDKCTGFDADMIGMAQTDKTAISKTEKSMLEVEADYFGMFSGFLAGYEIWSGG